MKTFATALITSVFLATPLVAQDRTRDVTGELSYLARIALPPDAQVTVEARGAFDTVLGEVQFSTEGRQVPIPFAFDIPPRLSGEVSAVIRVGGQPRWIVQDVPISAGSDPVDLGELRLAQVTPLAFATEFDCDGQPVLLGIIGDRIALRMRGRDIVMTEAMSASGARFVSEGEGTDEIEFWEKGGEAMLSINGTKVADCQRMSAPDETYRARGNEPGWTVTLGDETIEVVADYGELTRSAPRPEVEVAPGAYVFDMPQIAARLTLEDRICRDDATGMPYPHRAVLVLDDRELRGCGGDAASLLAAGDWRIEDVAGMGVVDDAQAEITLSRAGRLAGSTGCNRFFGTYELTGEGLSFGPVGATMMACPDALMMQERRIFEALEQVRRFDLDETGALLLIGGPEDAPLLKARRF
ncbi:Membrane-bound lysozyme-inhibitor of c-type lysozyme [Roseovarius litoreus]|uniref:Membrane-bound lysozyme-inhibitor of c-type lysozyme n=1 Tax=Roseovarius litoreus TaxID=1155722 RepID=A0A1M7K0V6_9RHOB|nr:META domain-containing protein [Roseovarius litoreus]SHM58962.1 Membrane-bound lysozyme-inhibitor of c-type lysozyme [Roseovarius litoreus]